MEIKGNSKYEQALSQYNCELNDADIKEIMEANRKTLNAEQPAYCHLTEIRIHEDEFEKTPKRSIKRFLYTK